MNVDNHPSEPIRGKAPVSAGTWKEIKYIVAEAAELEVGERLKLLDRLCKQPSIRAEVDSLLAALDEHGSLFEKGIDIGAESVAGRAPLRELEAGDWVGSYQILSRLGGGGMGQVYEARRQLPIERRVAIKLIRTDLDSEEVFRRFDAERQALALMEHPNIATIYEVGDAGGRPFLAMELIDGEPIDRFCDRRRLSLEQRLELFGTVCRSIQHAHMKGVIHRDLKPSNVLVIAEGDALTPKVIDFGIAKFLHSDLSSTGMTVAGQWLGTPDYMSPEQAAGAMATVDTRSDVYSLGVMLYSLLCGSLPLDAREIQRRDGLREWLRVIQEEDPPPPSRRLSTAREEVVEEAAVNRRLGTKALTRRLEGDLDCIVAKALSRDPEQRYFSPGELAADLERHLRMQPVLARPPAPVYLARRWLSRHRFAVSAAAILLLSLSAGLAGTSLGLVRAKAAEKAAQAEASRANREAATANQVKTFLGELFNGLNGYDPEVTPGQSLRTVLDRGSERIHTELVQQPLVQAELMVTLANSYLSLAAFDEALKLYRSGLEIYRRELGEMSAKVADCHNNIGAVYNSIDRPAEAEEPFRQALRIQQTLHDPNHLTVGRTLNNLGVSLKNQGRLDESLEILTQAVEIKRRFTGNGSSDLESSLTVLGLLHIERNEAANALAPLQEALAIMEPKLPDNHPRLAHPLNNLALAWIQLGDPAKARPLLNRALAIDEEAYGADHLNVAIGSYNLATLNWDAGSCTAAKDLYARTLRILELHFGPEHPKRIEVEGRVRLAEEKCG